jgi:hypothetical protein
MAIPLDELFQQGVANNRDFSMLVAELRRMLSSPDLSVAGAAASWICDIDGRFSLNEQERLLRDCLESVGSDSVAHNLRAAMSEAKWRQLSQAERRSYYAEAIRRGAVPLWEGRELKRSRALVLAAYEGLEEFAGAVRQYGRELDDPRDETSPRATDCLLWRMRLRAGASDQEDGDRLHGLRLAELSDAEFASKMSGDPAFEYVTILYSEASCQNTTSRDCRVVTSLARRQEERVLQEGPTSRPSPSWLVKLTNATRSAGFRHVVQ